MEGFEQSLACKTDFYDPLKRHVKKLGPAWRVLENAMPAAKIPPFTLEDFSITDAQRETLTEGFNERQRFMANRWIDVLAAVSNERWEEFDTLFDTEKMTYANPNRPDLGSFAMWAAGGKELAKTFPPNVYRPLEIFARGENEICTYNHHHGFHTGGPYMGVKPTGNELNALWFSIIRFEGDKIVHIYSISDVLSMLIDLEVISAPQPVDPYK